MGIETYYVKAASKKAINETLAAGKQVLATCHSVFNSCTKNITELNNGDVIKIYEKTVGGSPYAKAYGNWDAKKGRVK